jgi:hypothetical protein
VPLYNVAEINKVPYCKVAQIKKQAKKISALMLATRNAIVLLSISFFKSSQYSLSLANHQHPSMVAFF